MSVGPILGQGVHFSLFETYPIVAAVSPADGDARFKEDSAAAPEYRARFLRALELDPETLVCPQQIHGDHIFSVLKEHSGRGAVTRVSAIAEADALWTMECDLPLGILTADCVPVFFYDPVLHVASLAHVGWRGLAAGLPSKVLATLAKACGSEARNMLVGLGPAIRACCYEVGREVAEQFPKCCVSRAGQIYLDLAAGIRLELLAHGLRQTNMEISDICTFCDSNAWPSYRREGERSGRILSILALKPVE